MARYRKLPVEIEAVQWNGWWALSYDDVEAMAQNGPRTISLRGGELFISTLEGEMRADVGDWIIKGVNGEIYPCKPDIFAKTYEPADIPEAITQAIAMIAEASASSRKYQRPASGMVNYRWRPWLNSSIGWQRATMPRFEFDASDEIVMLAILRIYFGWDCKPAPELST
jgi:hypothetical protein